MEYLNYLNYDKLNKNRNFRFINNFMNTGNRRPGTKHNILLFNLKYPNRFAKLNA